MLAVMGVGVVIKAPVIEKENRRLHFFIANKSSIDGSVTYSKCVVFNEVIPILQIYNQLTVGTVVNIDGELKDCIVGNEYLANFVYVKRLEILAKKKLSGQSIDDFIEIYSPERLLKVKKDLQNKKRMAVHSSLKKIKEGEK